MSDWIIGQRCASQGEPALGLGIVKKIGSRNIHVSFPASDEERTYAVSKAPLRRVRFEPGEAVRDNYGMQFVVREVKEQQGLLFYLGETELLPETELNHATVFSRPHQKLLAGQINKPKSFDLRCKTWELKYRALASPCRGFIGARIELIPHQLYIAREVARRRHPRVLLSDEVGLGKTIEAGLIFHQLWISGEVKRVLCLVPGALIHQWLTEFYRKFNILFNIMSPTHAEEIVKSGDDNPYLCHQTVLQDIDQLAKDETLREQVLGGDWDLLIVDEAHHLYWSEKEPSAAYKLVEDLSHVCGGILLLTATPRQLGLESHFSRLKLLDPPRFDSFEKFKEETTQFTRLAAIAGRLLEGESDGIAEELQTMFPEDTALQEALPEGEIMSLHQSRELVKALVDRHGTGRMVFRNRRQVLSGFPKRLIHPISLEMTPLYREFIESSLDLLTDSEVAQRILAGPPAFNRRVFDHIDDKAAKFLQKAWREDPRLKWLLSFLRENEDTRFLLICSKKSVVLALQEWLGLAPDIEIAVFHEDLSVIERDRQAAYFAKDGGAQALICSEIGSEGRNFQFAHNLILFDLPLNPALLEQRIGRLDRIGQHRDIHIHIPYAEGSPTEYMFRWYHEALDAFENHLIEGDYIYEHLREKIFTVFEAVKNPDLMTAFNDESRHFLEDLKRAIKEGRDRLLEFNSFDRSVAELLIEAIDDVEDDGELKAFMDEVFEVAGIYVEDQLDGRSQILKPSPQMFMESFPGLPEDGLEITYDRDVAVMREDLTFLSYDHPMVSGSLDLMLGIERGSTSFSLWKSAPQPGLLIECLFIFECHGGEEVRMSRYLPPVPIKIAIDQNKNSRPDLLEQLKEIKLEKGPIGMLHKQREALTDIVEGLLVEAEEAAEEAAEGLSQEAEKRAMFELREEYQRLLALREINPDVVRAGELDYIEETLNLIVDFLEEASVRLDAIRLIMMVP